MFQRSVRCERTSPRAFGRPQLLEDQKEKGRGEPREPDDELPVAEVLRAPRERHEREHQQRGEGGEADEGLSSELREVVPACVGRRAAREVLATVEPRVGKEREVVEGRVLGERLPRGHERERDAAAQVDERAEEEATLA